MFVEDGIKKDDLVLVWDICDSSFSAPVLFYIKKNLCRDKLINNCITEWDYIIKYTPERARMTTKELMDTVVNKLVCPFCGYTMDYLSNEYEVYWLQCGNHGCLLSTPERPSREEALKAFKSIKVVRDE